MEPATSKLAPQKRKRNAANISTATFEIGKNRKLINLKLQTFAIFLYLRKDSLYKKPHQRWGLLFQLSEPFPAPQRQDSQSRLVLIM